MDRGFIFAADLVRNIVSPMVCHFLREQIRDVNQGNHARREAFFANSPDLKRRDVLVLDAVLDTGVTQEFLLPGGIAATVIAAGGAAGQDLRASGGIGAGLLWLSNGI